PDLINLARAFKATRAQIFWKIEFPASLPPLFAGLRIGSTLAVVGVVVGELVGGNMGLGYLLSFGEGQANTAMVFVAIVMLTLVGGIAYLLVILIEHSVLHYLPKRAQMRFSLPAQYICSASTPSPPGPAISPQASLAPTVPSRMRSGSPATLTTYLYLPGGHSSCGPSSE